MASVMFTLGGSYYLQRNFAAYRNLPASLKALGVVIVVAPAVTIQAERRSLRFERDRWYVDINFLPSKNLKPTCD